jgi:hypothetical protein
VAQVVEHLSSKCEALNSNPSAAKKQTKKKYKCLKDKLHSHLPYSTRVPIAYALLMGCLWSRLNFPKDGINFPSSTYIVWPSFFFF